MKIFQFVILLCFVINIFAFNTLNSLPKSTTRSTTATTNNARSASNKFSSNAVTTQEYGYFVKYNDNTCQGSPITYTGQKLQQCVVQSSSIAYLYSCNTDTTMLVIATYNITTDGLDSCSSQGNLIDSNSYNTGVCDNGIKYFCGQDLNDIAASNETYVVYAKYIPDESDDTVYLSKETPCSQTNPEMFISYPIHQCVETTLNNQQAWMEHNCNFANGANVVYYSNDHCTNVIEHQTLQTDPTCQAITYSDLISDLVYEQYFCFIGGDYQHVLYDDDSILHNTTDTYQGYLYLQEYSTDSCALFTETYSEGFKLNTCITYYNDANTSKNSVYYTCNGEEGYSYNYTQPFCQGTEIQTRFSIGDCVVDGTNSYQVLCSSIENQIPVVAQSVLKSYYDNNTCTGSINHYESVSSGACFKYGDYYVNETCLAGSKLLLLKSLYN